MSSSRENEREVKSVFRVTFFKMARPVYFVDSSRWLSDIFIATRFLSHRNILRKEFYRERLAIFSKDSEIYRLFLIFAADMRIGRSAYPI